VKDLALRHLLTAAARSVTDLAPHHGPDVAAAVASLRVERRGPGHHVLRWTDAAGTQHEHDLERHRFHLYGRGDVAGHVARRGPDADHRHHNWNVAHEVWAEVLGVDPASLRPTRRTFSPRSAAGDGRTEAHRRAGRWGAAAGALAAVALVRRPAPSSASVVGTLAVGAAALGPDAPAVLRLAPAGAAATNIAPAWGIAAALLAGADVAAARLRREDERARRAAITAAATAAAVGLRRTLLGPGTPPRTRPARPRDAGPGIAVGLAAAALTAQRAPHGTRDRLSGWLAPLALSAAAAGAEADGDRSAPMVAAAVVGVLVGRDLARRLTRRDGTGRSTSEARVPRPGQLASRDPATPPASATGSGTTSAEPVAVVVSLPRRRSA